MAMFKSLTGSLLLDCALLAALIYVAACIRSYYRLRHIPGPTAWAWSIIPLFMVHLRGDIYEKLGNLNRKYGPVVRIAPNTLLVSDGNVLRRMNAARSPYTRSDWYTAMRLVPGKDNVLSVLDDRVHEAKRRKMAAGYSGKDNPTLEEDIDECVRDLCELIDTKYISDPPNQILPMDLARKIQFFTSDIMSKLSFDAKFHDLRDDVDNFDYIHEIETIFPNIFCICTIPSVVKLLTSMGVMQLFAPSVNSKFGLGRVLAITSEQVSRRFDEEGKLRDNKNDMLGSFIRHGLSRDEAEQESVLQLAAGSDTTATGIRATSLAIMTNPRVYARLTAEIQAAVSSGRITSGADDIISDEQARELPYLQACIKEGLRWHPPIAGMLAKKTPPEGDDICGHFVPGGVSVGYSAKGTHHSPALFGPDEEMFRPERWILTTEGGDEPSADKLREMERNNELVFGHGKYQCLGKNVAAIELNKVIFELLRRFEMTIVDPRNVWSTSCYGIFLQRDLWVTVRRRSTD